MIAKIGKSGNLYGALAYNHTKVEKEQGQILFANRIIETPNGVYTVSQLAQSFEPYLIANRNTEKHTIHISLNPDPKDQVNDEKFRELAQEYMREMGYGEQPYVVFKHTDIDRTHIHIVSLCVNEQGKKISDKFEKLRSMKICRELESKHGLINATDKKRHQNDVVFRPVDYRSGDVKKQVASIIRQLPIYYKFQTLGEYNALLSLFNITIEMVDNTIGNKSVKGLLYIPLNEKGKKIGTPFKSSLFGRNVGLNDLEIYFEKCKSEMKKHPSKFTLKSTISTVLCETVNEMDFKKELIAKGINVILRKNDTGRIYGITFIDHHSKTVWNGSRLGKELSANVFNGIWNNDNTTNIKEPEVAKNEIPMMNQGDSPLEEPHSLFDFLHSEPQKEHLNEVLGSLLPDFQKEDYEEQDFANQMKKRRRKKKRR